MRAHRIRDDISQHPPVPNCGCVHTGRTRDINLYMEFYSLGDISTIINQLKSQNVQIYDIDIERNKSGEALHPSAIFSIRLNEKIPHTQLLSDLAELDCFA